MNSLMEKEIFEQSTVIGDLISKYIVNYCVMVDFPSKVKKVTFIASGSSYNCARLGAKFFRDIAKISAECEFSSEFLSSKGTEAEPDTLYFFISQSGETSDTLLAMEKVKNAGAKAFALVNNSDSSLYKGADFSLCAEAGVEKSIAATKSFTACVFCTWLCALKAAQNKSKNISAHLLNISNIAKDLDETLTLSGEIEKAAAFLSGFKSIPIVGYDYYLEAAKEGALKTKETSFIDANAYPLGEFLHGHIAVLNRQNALVEIYTDDATDFEIKNLRKIDDDYNPKIVAITDFSGKTSAKHTILFKKTQCTVTRVLMIILILQLLALKIAYKLKCDVDTPRGLSKVVR